MKKTMITYVPSIVVVIAGIVSVCIVMVAAALFGEPGLCIGGLIGIAVFLYFLTRRTEVEYGEGNVIKCRCAFYKWKIELEDIDSFVYTISEHLTRGGPRYTIDIRFNHSKKGVEDYYKLSSLLLGKELEKMMRNDADKLEIMKIYKYAESLYPDKAKGFTKREGAND